MRKLEWLAPVSSFVTVMYFRVYFLDRLLMKDFVLINFHGVQRDENDLRSCVRFIISNLD